MAQVCGLETAIQAKEGGLMTPMRAREILGLHNGYTAADVQAAFVEKAKANHPDQGGNGDMHALTHAKRTLLQMLQGEITCGQCEGKGVTKSKFGAVPCGKCDGEGVVYQGA